MGKLTDRIAALEACHPNRTLGPFTANEIKGVDDLTLCRFAIQDAERAIAEGCTAVFDADTRNLFGVSGDEELLTVLRGWLAEMEGQHASA